MTETGTEICAVCGSRILGSTAFCVTCAFTSVFDDSGASGMAAEDGGSSDSWRAGFIGPDVAGPPGYRFRGVVGRGGMGTVYKAVRTDGNLDVALKFISIAGARDDRGAMRFQREADALTSLKHPNIVKVRDVGSWRGRQFIAMDWIDGVGFDIWVSAARKDAARLPERLQAKAHAEILRRSVVALKTVARAVAHTHSEGFIHRDLKPGNILVDRLDEPHVVDFGLARKLEETEELTWTGEILGTAQFMSPEQAGGERGQVSEASDIFSLGGILHWLVSGRVPSDGESRESQAALAPGGEVDADLEAVALRCLRREQDRRYASAGQVADELRRWLRGGNVLARATIKEDEDSGA